MNWLHTITIINVNIVLIPVLWTVLLAIASCSHVKNTVSVSGHHQWNSYAWSLVSSYLCRCDSNTSDSELLILY